MYENAEKLNAILFLVMDVYRSDRSFKGRLLSRIGDKQYSCIDKIAIGSLRLECSIHR
jgi:hypothetical protein